MGDLICPVIGNNRLQGGIRELTLALTPESPSFKAGQYLMLDVGDGAFPFSIASAPNQHSLSLHIRPTQGSADSDRIERFLDSHPATASVHYPLGDCFVDQLPTKPVLLIAASTGVTQMISIIDWLIENAFAHSIDLYWGVLTPEELYLQAGLETRSAKSQLRYTPVVSHETDGWPGRTGLVGEAVTADIAQLNDYQVFVGGSPAMVYGTLDHFERHGFNSENMQSDVFSYAPRP